MPSRCSVVRRYRGILTLSGFCLLRATACTLDLLAPCICRRRVLCASASGRPCGPSRGPPPREFPAGGDPRPAFRPPPLLRRESGSPACGAGSFFALRAGGATRCRGQRVAAPVLGSGLATLAPLRPPPAGQRATPAAGPFSSAPAGFEMMIFRIPLKTLRFDIPAPDHRGSRFQRDPRCDHHLSHQEVRLLLLLVLPPALRLGPPSSRCSRYCIVRRESKQEGSVVGVYLPLPLVGLCPNPSWGSLLLRNGDVTALNKRK